jgi:transcriptional regulator with XRE-family HTH domain
MKSSEYQDPLSAGVRFGRLVHEKRTAANLGLNELAGEVHLSRWFLSRLERGYFSDIRLTAVAKLVRRLSISMDELNVATGCTLTGDLLDLDSYLQAMFPTWPAEAIHAAARYCKLLDEKYSEKRGGDT